MGILPGPTHIHELQAILNGDEAWFLLAARFALGPGSNQAFALSPSGVASSKPERCPSATNITRRRRSPRNALPGMVRVDARAVAALATAESPLDQARSAVQRAAEMAPMRSPALS